jgi:hypothetical protein
MGCAIRMILRDQGLLKRDDFWLPCMTKLGGDLECRYKSQTKGLVSLIFDNLHSMVSYIGLFVDLQSHRQNQHQRLKVPPSYGLRSALAIPLR